MQMRLSRQTLWLVGCLTAALVSNVSVVVAASGSKAAPVIKVGQTVQVKLDKSQAANFVIGLPKGSFLIVCDTQAQEGQSVVQAGVKLLKANGAALADYSGSLLSWYEFNSIWRAGKIITLKKPLSARLRIENSNLSSGAFWLTVLPSPPKKFQPFGFGATVTAARIGDNNGVGGTFKAGENRFYRAVLPAGKWDVSLGARPVGDAYVNAQLTILDANGLATGYPTATTESSSGEARKEVTITLKKPTTLIIQARNRSNNGGTLEHDVTVSKSDD